jgi:2-oxoglutarate ferredoxin oxidoreductase subunit beta
VESLKKAFLNPGFSLVHFIYPCVTHFGAVSLKERNKKKVIEWFKNLFSSKGRFKSGVFHDTSGSRPEFTAQLKSFTENIKRQGI